MVSLLVPNDTVSAMIKLSDPIIRAEAGVDDSNMFVFASMKEVCSYVKLKFPDLLNATNNRHRVSTIYASYDIPKREGEIFYTHMGQGWQN